MHRRASHAIFIHRRGFSTFRRECVASQPVAGSKITCDVLRCIFQHVGISAPDFGISKLFIIRFLNGLQYCDADSIPFHVICDSKLSSRYF